MNRSRRRLAGFTLIEILIVLVIVAVVGGLLIISVKRAREAANRAACQNNLRQLALGVRNHQDQRGDLPPMAMRSEGLSWAAVLMPYVEQMGFYRWPSPQQKLVESGNDCLAKETSSYPFFFCPSKRRWPNMVAAVNGKKYSAADYAVPSAVDSRVRNPEWADSWTDNCDSPDFQLGPFVALSGVEEWSRTEARRYRSRTSLASLDDGAANQIIFGEKALHPDDVLNPKRGDSTVYLWQRRSVYAAGSTRNAGDGVSRHVYENRDAGAGPHGYPGGASAFLFGSWHPDVVPFAYADGHVHFLSTDINPTALEVQCIRNDSVQVDLAKTVGPARDDAATGDAKSGE